ncbi:MAG: PKD domain-containing protein [Bacteroidia bacterium]|nr:PKD domain-containing protein [Bacteroidia bacterium]
MNKHSGCSPILVQFTNQSSGSGTLNYSWDLGNGNHSSLVHPQASYINPGNYTVSLSVSNGTNSASVSAIITVYANPVAAFTMNDSAGCVPVSTTFADNSISVDAPVISRLWDFGDGSTGDIQNPVHTYSTGGNFPVTLQVTDAHGCKTTTNKNKSVTAFPLPDINFSANHETNCSDTTPVIFDLINSGAPLLMYFWNFGDMGYSFEQEPAHIYEVNGNYTVKLTVVDVNQCVNTVIKEDYIKIYNDVAEFNIIRDTVCRWENIQFQLLSQVATSYFWDFGDGSTSGKKAPQHFYIEPGNYTISLTASVNGECTDVFSRTIIVDYVNAGFIADNHYSCELPAFVQFTDLSSNAVTYDWRFGNGGISNQQTPVNSYYQVSGNAHDGQYIFNDTLIVTSQTGCKDTAISEQNMLIALPHARFDPSNTPDFIDPLLSGCIPITAPFHDNSQYNSAVDSIISWHWDFGTGDISNYRNPVYTFQDTGTFIMSLTITTALGCTSTNSSEVYTGTPQTAAFEMLTPSVICASDPVIFADLSTDQNLINGWFWDFGDGIVSYSQNASHLFIDTGYMDVTLAVAYNYCFSEPYTLEDIVYIKGPVADFYRNVNCDEPYTGSYHGLLIDADYFIWDLGDGTMVNNAPSPVHQYTTTGDYMVMLYAENYGTGCNYLTEKTIPFRAIKSEFTADTIVGCPGLEVQFDGSPSVDEDNFPFMGDYYKYLWNFDDGYGDTASTGVLTNIPLSIHFINNSLTDTTTFWYWSFGDGQASSLGSPVHIYDSTGLFSVQLTMSNILGCADSLSREDYIISSKPNPEFIVSDISLCAGDQITLQPKYPDEQNIYSWDFGDGQAVEGAVQHHAYADSGMFTISLLVADVYGCDSSLSKSDIINVENYPAAQFSADTLYSNCYPLLVKFTDESISSDISSWNWQLGDTQSQSTFQNPQHNYAEPGIYDITLIVATTNGCADTAVKNAYIDVGGPYAEIIASDTACKGEEIQLTIYNPVSIYSFTWDLGDGILMQGTPVFHIYDRLGFIYPRLLLYADSIHTCDRYIEDSIYINELFASFRINNLTFCEPFTAEIDNQSYGAAEYLWDFGNGFNSTGFEPQPYYPVPGTYALNLITYNDFGCTDTTSASIQVYPLPEISVSADTLICEGQSLKLQASGGISYYWTNAAGLEAGATANPVVTPLFNENYFVTVTDVNNCSATETMLITVQEYPEFTLSNDTAVVIGENSYLTANVPDIYSFYWLPVTSLSCAECLNPVVNPLETTVYTIFVSDTNNCFVAEKSVTVEIIKVYSIDVPTAFTPDNDGINDIVYVDGWGLKSLKQFKIFNQWGELVFESHDLNYGWDGYYKGQLQNSDTYVYYAEAETFGGVLISKKGNMSILR